MRKVFFNGFSFLNEIRSDTISWMRRGKEGCPLEGREDGGRERVGGARRQSVLSAKIP